MPNYVKPPDDKGAEIVRAAVYSNLSPRAMRCWLRIFFVEGGKIDVFDIVLNNLGIEVGELLDKEWCRIHRTDVHAICPISTYGTLADLDGRERAEAAIRKPKLKGADAVIAEVKDELFDFYNRKRREVGIASARRGQSHEKYLARLARWLLEQRVDRDAYFGWAYERTKWTRTPYPTISMLAGEWLQGMWLDRDPEAEIVFGHAGKSYIEPETSFGQRLAKAGLGRWDKAMCRHIAKEAKTAREKPHLRTPSKDKRLEAAIRWVAEHGVEGDE